MRLRNITGSKEIIAASRWVIQEPKEMKGRWEEVFRNNGKIQIEVGMGKGRFIMDMAAAHPDINYIGIEMYDSVLLRAVQKADERYPDTKDTNFRFIRMDARELFTVFSSDEVDKIYLNFSDPWPKDRHAKRRLTSRNFLSVYKQIVPSGHTVEFKTDNKTLFEFSLNEVELSDWTLIASTDDLHHDDALNPGNIMTEYEEKFSSLGNPIYKLIARRP